MRSSYAIALGIALAASLYLASGYFSGKEVASPAATPAARAPENGPAAQEDPLRVSTIHLKATTRQRTVTLRGKVIADREIEVRAKTSGTVDRILVDKGQPVTEGQELMTLTSEERQAKLAETKAALRQRQLEATAQNTLAKKGFAANMSVADANAKLALAQAETKAMEVEIDHLSIRAPADGILDRRTAEAGKYVAQGENVAVLVDLDPVLAIGYATEQEVLGLKLGQKAIVTFLSGVKHDGSVRYIAAAADETTRTFRVEIAIPNPDKSLRHGQSAEMNIPVETELVQIIPQSAIGLDSEGRFGIKVVGSEQKVQFLPATIVGESAEGLWLSNLPIEIELIVTGQEFVRPGDKVAPVPEGNKNP